MNSPGRGQLTTNTDGEDGGGEDREPSEIQAELFYADTDWEVGDDVVGGDRFAVHPEVFGVSVVLIAAVILGTLFFDSIASMVGWMVVDEGLGLADDPATAEYAFGLVSGFINVNFGWLYIAAANVFIAVVLFFALGRFGAIRIGGVGAETEFSTFSWMAMLFSAGMGIGLMFWSVGEPISHFTAPPTGVEPETAAAAETAMAFTFFHWGVHPWAIYALVATGLAFFTFNRGLPLTFRSLFWPLLGDRIYGPLGHAIDTLAVFATLFGLATSLGLGAGQINAGLAFLSGEHVAAGTVPVGAGVQVALIAIITLIAAVSVGAGLDKGVRRLSEVNVYLMLALLASILVLGPTLFILGSSVENVGAYIDAFPEMAFWTESYTDEGWQADWTLFYWGWWIAWSPFVGMFIARVSYGRTVRQLILGVLVLPTMFSFFWMSAFGGSALWVELETDESMTAAVAENVATATFELFAAFPLTALTSVVGVILVVTFFVTSSDSGSLVIGSLTAGGTPDAPRNLRLFWAIIEGAVAAVLLLGGGLAALQTAAIATGLPFSVVLLFTCYTVYLGLHREYRILESTEFRTRLEERAEGSLEFGSGPYPTVADDDD